MSATTGLSISALDRAFPLGYRPPPLDDAQRARCKARFAALGITPDRFILCFFGTIGHQFDLATVIRAARLLAIPGSLLDR